MDMHDVSKLDAFEKEALLQWLLYTTPPYEIIRKFGAIAPNVVNKLYPCVDKNGIEHPHYVITRQLRQEA